MLSSCKATKFKIENKPLTKHFEINPIFLESHTGLMVYDPVSNTNIFEYNSHKHFTPASNTKLLTYLAALIMMGDSLPAIQYCIVNDHFYFAGTGDPTLLYENFGYATTLNFLSEQKAPLVYVEKSMEDKRFGPGWAWDDYPYYYSAEKSTFPIYGNMVQIKKDRNSTDIHLLPKEFEILIQDMKDSLDIEPLIRREEFNNIFFINQIDSALLIQESIPFRYSTKLFVSLLADTLKKPINLASQFPECEKLYYYAVPSDSVYKHILVESDNFLAEQLLLVISNQLGDTLSSRKVIEHLINGELSELNEEINWVDGSGLSRYNQVTPNGMVNILRRIYKKVPREKLFDLMPESGNSGTMENSFINLKGKIHAKTGSMSHVYNLSGFLETNSGNTLIFSFMNNNFTISFNDLKTEMERVLSVFVNN